MDRLEFVIKQLDEATAELKRSNDIAEAELVERLRANRRAMNRPDDVGEPRPDNVGLVCAHCIFRDNRG